MFSRRELLIRSSQVIEAGAVYTVSNACYNLTPQTVPTKEVQPTPNPIDKWKTQSPTTRLQLLETEKAPIAASEVRKEIAIAVGETICAQMKCSVMPEEMAARLHFLAPEDFLNQLEKTIGVKFNESDRQRELTERLEFIGNDEQVNVNNMLWEKVNTTLSPNVRAMLTGRNTAMVVGKSLDFHAFTHLVESKEEFFFSPFSFKVYGLAVPEVGKLVGLKFIGRAEDGSIIYLTGAHEASTELAAGIMANRKAPLYTSLAYDNGARLLAEINSKAGISDDQFLKVKDGSLNTKWYLEKIASIQNPRNSDIKKALLALALIALAQAGATNWVEARRGAFDWLTPDTQPTAIPTSIIRLPSR